MRKASEYRICCFCGFSQFQHDGGFNGFCPQKVDGKWDGKTYCEGQKFEGCPVIREDGCNNGETMIGQRWR